MPGLRVFTKKLSKVFDLIRTLTGAQATMFCLQATSFVEITLLIFAKPQFKKVYNSDYDTHPHIKRIRDKYQAWVAKFILGSLQIEVETIDIIRFGKCAY